MWKAVENRAHREAQWRSLTRLALVALLLAHGALWAKDPANWTTHDPKRIADTIEKIVSDEKGTGHNRLSDLLEDLEMKVDYLMVFTITAEDLKNETWLRQGDVEYRFFANNPPDWIIKICPGMEYSTFNIVKRGKHWLAMDRNSNFILNKHCRWPRGIQ